MRDKELVTQVIKAAAPPWLYIGSTSENLEKR